jgi:hypothetical protein
MRLCVVALAVSLLLTGSSAVKPGPVFLFSMYALAPTSRDPTSRPNALPSSSHRSLFLVVCGGGVISDGMRTDYLQQARSLGLPTLTRLIEGGTLASASQTVWPAVTFPSHTRHARA